MVTQHLGKAITEPQRRRWVNLLLDAADEVGLPADPEFRAAFLGYLEWGTRIAFANSQPGAHPPLQAPVPHWGWGVAPPYKPTVKAAQSFLR
jgi:hemoglobin